MSWLKEAEHLTKHKFLAIPLNNGVPTVKYDKRREILASEQELNEWFSNNNKNVNGIAIAINKTEFAIDTDGEECENIFVEKVIAQLSKNLQNKINKTMYTKSPHGHHRTFRIKLEDFPDGIKTDKYLVIGNNHSEIAVVGKEHILRERSPEHKVINGVECLVILEKAEVDELFKALNKLKESDAAMKVADLLLPYYYQPHRDAIIFSLSGFLHKSKTPQHITEKIALHLINLTKYHDEDTNKVLRTIKDTYAKDRNSADVSGYNKFLEALEAAYPHKDRIGNDNNGNDGSPSDIISKIQSILYKVGLIEPPARRQQDYSADGIPEQIATELGDNIYLKINDDPIILIVAHEGTSRIVRAKVNYHNEGTGQNQRIIYTLNYKNTIIDAIPTKVIINESPIDGTKTYQITFSHKGVGRPFTVGPGSVKTIIALLQDRGRYIDEDADKFLTGILTKYEDNELAQFNNKVLQPGYYYVDGRIEGYDITQKLDKKINKTEAVECIEVVEGLRGKYRKKEIIPTAIKWGIVAPFSYIKKCHSVSGSNWLPALTPYGRKRTGKNTIGVIALAVSRKHTVKDKPLHQIGVGNIDSPAKFGRAVSQTTYPIMSSEVDLANEKLRWLVEMIKYAIESTTVRGRHVDKYRYEDIQALSNIILTSNHRPPKDDAFLTRIIPIHLSRKDDTTPEQKKNFEKWLFDEGRIDKLGVLGDFATNMIMANPKILLDNRWEDTAKIILLEFYKYAGKDTPEWIDYIMEEDVSGQADEESELEIRAFFINIINDAYNKFVRTLPLEKQNDTIAKAIQNSSMLSRLNLCLQNNVIPFLHEHIDKGLGQKDDRISIIITSDIMSVIKKYDMRNIVTLKDVADELDFEYKQVKLGGKPVWAVKTVRQNFVDLLDGELEAINNNDDNDNNQEGTN